MRDQTQVPGVPGARGAGAPPGLPAGARLGPQGGRAGEPAGQERFGRREAFDHTYLDEFVLAWSNP